MFRANDISLSFESEVLSKVSLTVSKGEIIGLVGKSGAGKSSLLKIMAGLIDQDSGEVWLNDQLQPKSSLRLIPGSSGVELVNQDFKLDVYHTVEENIRESILKGRVEKNLKNFTLLNQSCIRDPDLTVEDYIKNHVSLLGENIQINRFTKFIVGS